MTIGKIKVNRAFKFSPFSKKQKKIFAWWMKGSPYENHDGIIAHGSIRAGKTLPMSMSFVMWAMENFDGYNFAMAGKTVASFKRNVWFQLTIVMKQRGYKIVKRAQIAPNCYSIQKNGKMNFFYMFGGRDERSQDDIQGITLAGLYLDEVALMPESFVTQATGRLSVTGAKAWYNCNPKGPKHWFKTDYIDRANDLNYLVLHFELDDNLSLSEDVKERYRSMYKGLFFLRYILGLWAFADGVIYSMFNEEDHTYTDATCPVKWNLPYTRYYTLDYGTKNPFVCLEVIKQGDMHYVNDEYSYDSSKHNGKQKSDEEYVNELKEFIGGKKYNVIIVDPSALSFKVAATKRGLRIYDAKNAVLDGIRLVSSLLTLKKLKFNKDRCKTPVGEMYEYIWDQKKGERGLEEPIKQSDHGLDAIRYYANTIIRRV